jgi:hypothetical protein
MEQMEQAKFPAETCDENLAGYVGARHLRRQIARNNDSGVVNFAPDTWGTL